MTYTEIDTLPDDYAVIDLDTGTVLGTNLMLVRMPDENYTPGATDDILSSDSSAFDYAKHNGIRLFAKMEA